MNSTKKFSPQETVKINPDYAMESWKLRNLVHQGGARRLG